MPDVGVLNLQIQTDASAAADGLGQLAGKLKAVKDAVKGLGLSTVANGLKKINEALGQIDTTAVSKLNAITAALERMSAAAGNVGGISISFGGRGRNAEDLSNITERMQAARESAAQITAEFEQVGSRIQEDKDGVEGFAGTIDRTRELVQEMGYSAQTTAEQFQQMFNGLNIMRMSRALGDGMGAIKPWFDSWKDGAIEVEGSVSDGMGSVRDHIGETIGLLEGESTAQEAVTAQVTRTNAELEEEMRIRREIVNAENEARQARNFPAYKEMYASGDEQAQQIALNMSGLTPKALEEAETYAEAVKITMQEVNEYVDRFIDNMNMPTGPLLRDAIDQAMSSKLAMKDAAESADVLKNAPEIADNAGQIESSMHTVSDAMNEARTPSEMFAAAIGTVRGSLATLVTNLSSTGDEVRTLGQRFSDLMFGVEGLNGAFGRMFPTLSGLLKRFGQLVKYRMLRAIIKQISEGFKEGYENYYKYSEAIGSDFAPAMDSAATSLLQMKNSIGAAVAPLLQSLVPVLQTVVDWFINLVNYANQFFALMRGQSTWSMAQKKSTKAFDEQTKKAKQTGKALKNLLADWDELNIIQSQGGGGTGGTGTKDLKEYVDMFKEISEFDENIRKIVEDIKARFGSVLGLIKKIGLGILGWKVSRAFGGILGVLGGLIAGATLIDLEFNISTILNNRYFDTGDEGWLIADVLKALIGGALMGKILTSVLGAHWGMLGIPIMLTVNAFARVITELGRSDVSALSEEALKANVVSALELGGVAGYLYYTSGASMGEALLGGAAMALFTFGAITNLKADVEAIQNGEVTGDTIKAKALGSVAMGVGAAMAAKLLVPGVSTARAAGFGLATGAAAFLLTMSATLGITATTEAVKSGITEDVLLKDVGSSLSMGLGAGIVLKMAGLAETWTLAAAGGAGIALVTAGALIGIQATTEAVKNDSLDADTIIKDATSSLLIGGGVALIAGVLCGVGAGAALTYGGLAALAVFGALIGIQALLRLAQGEDSINWGDYEADQATIEAWVKDHGFTANVSATLTLVDNTVTILPSERKKIQENAASLIPTLQVIKYGLATEDTYNQLKEALFGTDGNGGVVGDVKKYAEEQKTLIQTSFTLVPIVDTENKVDEEASKEMIKAGTTGWTEVEEYMEKIGGQLAEALTGGTADGLKNFDDDLILELTNKLNNVQQALAQSQISSGALGDMMTGLSGLTKESFSSAVGVWDNYKKELQDRYSSMLQEEYASFKSLADFYAARGEEGDEELAAYYEGKANELLDMWDERLNAAVDKMAEPGRKRFKNAILSMLNVEITDDDINSALVESGYSNFDMDNFIGSLFDSKGNIQGVSGERFDKYLQDVIEYAFPDNYDVIKQLMDAGVLDYADLIPYEMVSHIADGFLGEHPELTNAWNEFIKGFYPDVQGKTKEAANEAAESVKEEIEDAMNSQGTFDIPGIGQMLQEALGQDSGETEMPTVDYDYVVDVDPALEETVSVPTVDSSAFVQSVQNMATETEAAIRRIQKAFGLLDGESVTLGSSMFGTGTGGGGLRWTAQLRASGGYVRSGDLVMANENGNFEMMGQMGHQPVVANNDQIVAGITRGVAEGNDDVVSALNAVVTLMQRLEQKEIVARVVPSSAMGRNNQQSAEAYSRVTG